MDDERGFYLLSKLVLNSSYGKFGQNPDSFYDWHKKTIDVATMQP